MIKIAKVLGERTWQMGLLKSGNGLTNGIAGNGYAMYALHRIFKFMAKAETIEVSKKDEY